MSDELHSALVAPRGTWWNPAGIQEKRWVILSFIWCIVLFAMMPIFHIRGGQNPSGIRAKVQPAAYVQRVDRFVNDYKVGTDNGVPVVAPPAGADIYLLGRMWAWYPVLKLKKGVEYTLHLSSADVNHGFSLFPVNINVQVVPGYDYGLKVTPNQSGDFRIICNEFCGIGHHIMIGKVIVEE
jgi:cytochrome c oxidase subunit II